LPANIRQMPTPRRADARRQNLPARGVQLAALLPSGGFSLYASYFPVE
jgi:hypothetical protein